MSFGIFKNGVNNTDKKLIKRYVAAGWSVDKMSSKLSVKPSVIELCIAKDAKDAAPEKKASKKKAAAPAVDAAAATDSA